MNILALSCTLVSLEPSQPSCLLASSGHSGNLGRVNEIKWKVNKMMCREHVHT